MLSLVELNYSKVTLTKNLLTTQDYQHITCRLNSAGSTFDANGLGTGASSTSTVYVVHLGGFNDQQIAATMKYVAPTTQAGSEIGVTARFQSLETTNDSTYYYARVDGGTAKLTKVVGGTFTALASGAWALPQDTYCTITLRVVGSALTATFHDETAGLSDLQLTATDTAIPTGGLMGMRSLTSSIAISAFTAVML